MKRLAGVEPIPAGVVARQRPRHERPDPIGPGREPPRHRGDRRRVVLSQVEVAAAVKLDDPALAGCSVGRQLLVVDDPGAGHVEDPPARVVKALAEVGLVGVDEELGVEVADLRRPPRRRTASPPTAPSRPRGCRRRAHWVTRRRCRKRAPAIDVPRPGSRQAHGRGAPEGSSSCAPAAAARRSARSAPTSASAAPGSSSESSLSSRQISPRASRSSLLSSVALPSRRSPRISRRPSPRPSGAAFQASTASADPSSDALSRTRTSASIPAAPYSRIESRQASSSSRPLVLTTQ